MSSHNIMIHHLHGDGLKPINGSVPLSKLEKILDKWPDTVFTFDDRLPSQVLALDWLKMKGIKAYFFVNHHNEMEQDRLTREDMHGFYDWFFSEYQKTLIASLKGYVDPVGTARFIMPGNFLGQYDFYSEDERLYRYIRDIFAPDVHDSIMRPLRREVELLDLDLIKDHEVGLHSFSHPRRISKLHWRAQVREYRLNLEMIPGATSMSHPMGDYSDVTLGILDALGIKEGFRADDIKEIYSNLEKPRIDVNNIHL